MNEPRNIVSTSPLPRSIEKEKTQMDFLTAFRKAIEGKNVTRLEWEDPNYYMTTINKRVQLHKPDGNLYDFQIREVDYMGEDWVVVDG